MTALARLVSVALAGTLLGGALDRPGPEGRVVAGTPAALRAAVPAGLPAFATFGWVSPPLPFQTAERYAELAGAGLNLALPVQDDSGFVADNLARLDLAAAAGVRCLIWDRRFERVHVDSLAGRVLLDSIVATYRDHPGFGGYYLGDEPAAESFHLYIGLFDSLRARDPGHPAWNNLRGRNAFMTRAAWIDYLHDYVERVHPSVLCDDQYDFLIAGDSNQFVENAAGLAAVARETGLPFWVIVLLIEHGDYRPVTDGMLRWQVSMALAYGARGVGYFTYWTPAPDPRFNWQPAVLARDGTRTPRYAALAAFDPRVRAAGEALGALGWLATVHAGSLPAGATAFTPNDWISAVGGRAALGYFSGAGGARYVLVANSDSSATRSITLAMPFDTAAARLGDAPGAWTSLPVTRDGAGGQVTVALDAGDFALLRLEGDFGGTLTAGAGRRIALASNPAAGEARLSLGPLAEGAHVDIVDAAGRRMWSRPLEGSSARIAWRGERDGGGAAPAGIYFVRLEDRRGVSALRLAWLGR